MARRVALLLLVGLVDPDARDLADAAADAHVDGDGEARRGRGEDVGRQPADHGRDAGEGAGRGHDEAAVAGFVGVGGERGRDDEADGSDGGGEGRVHAASVEVIRRPGNGDLTD